MKLFSSRCRSHLRSPSVSTRVWPVPLPQPTLLKVGHPPLAVTLRVLRLTSGRQLAECLHPAVMCFWLDPPPTKGWAQGKAQRQRISGGVNKRYTLQLGRVVCGGALCGCRPAAARWAPLDFPDLPPTIRMQLCFCLCWPCRSMEVCYECIVLLLSFRLGDYWLNRAPFIYLFISKLDHLSGANGTAAQQRADGYAGVGSPGRSRTLDSTWKAFLERKGRVSWSLNQEINSQVQLALFGMKRVPY